MPETIAHAPAKFCHWWSQLKFRLQNKKGWNEMVDEFFLLQSKRVNEIPLFLAAKENDVGYITKLLKCPSTYIFERGALGETALHVAVLSGNVEAAVALMTGAPELINEPMTSDLHQGMTALHIAVMNQHLNMVQEFIRRGADVCTPRVTGLYFQKRKGGLLYYGEHILSFACCTGNEEIINFLINAGANIRAQDSRGNTSVHIMVLQPNKTIACQIIDLLLLKDAELDRAVPLDAIPNYRGLTAFKLAAKKGNAVVFQHLVNRRSIVQWNLGYLSSTLYDLTEIDSWDDRHSVLQLIASSRNREAREILELTPLKELVRLKWNVYGKHFFRLWLLVYLLYIIFFTLCCVNRPMKDIPENYTKPVSDYTVRIQKTLAESYITYEDHLRLAGEIISIIGAIIILLVEIPDMLRVGAKRYFGQTALGGPFHITFITYACVVVLLLILRTCSLPGEIVVMPIALVLGWCNVLYFARGFEMLGPHVIEIQKIIFGDMVKFIWLMIIVLIGFSSALWVVYMTQEIDSLPSYRSFPVALFSQFELTMGRIDLPVDQSLMISPIVHVVHCAFSVVSCVLLFNLLAAMMEDTHERVTEEREQLWRTQVVASILMVERRLPRFLWPRFGVCGLEYGLMDRWYLRVENRNDKLHKIRRCIAAYSKDVYKKEEKSDFAITAHKKNDWDPDHMSFQKWEAHNEKSHI